MSHQLFKSQFELCLAHMIFDIIVSMYLWTYFPNSMFRKAKTTRHISFCPF